MSFRIPAICIVFAGLAACTGSTDPATGTVFDNFRNLQSGEFDRQIDAKRAEAGAIIAANNQQQARINSLENQRSSNNAAISSLRGQLTAVRSDIAAARQAAAGDPATQARLDALESQASAVESDVSRGGDANIASGELSRIRAAVRALSG